MSLIKDIGWILAGLLVAPALMALALAGIASLIARHAYAWVGHHELTLATLEVAPVRVRRTP